MRPVLLLRAALFALVAFVVTPAFATGPLALCQPGRPYLWANGGSAIPFNPDQGPLGPLSHAQAVAAVKDAFDTWGAVPTTTARYVQGAELPVDVDITNFGPYLDAPAPDGLSAIVFDHTGEIFDLLFGANSGVLGFAGPEWGDTPTCTITEGFSFLNGPAFDDLVAAKDVMVHEFGHYSNLAHTVVNGQIILAGDESGPTPNNTFGLPASIDVIETMYPFYFGPGSGTASLHADDIAGISTLYPAAGFGARASIEGRILASNGTTRLSGVNVIARNIANPFLDAVSAISGDRTPGTTQDDALVGTYRLNGLTPGATYAVYVDQVLDGGFSTDPIAIPGVEEFYSGPGETSDDDPAAFAPVPVSGGATTAGIDVVFNAPKPGDPLATGDDGAVQLALPFTFKLCGQSFDAVFVNGNGNLTFGAAGPQFAESVPVMLGGVPRIAGLWDDLDVTAGGKITFRQSATSFTVQYIDVPEFRLGGANSFDITLRKDNTVAISYGGITATDGLAGLSCGGKATSGFENETSLSSVRNIDMQRVAAAYEIFTAADNDLANRRLTFAGFKNELRETFGGRNHSVATATRVSLPFESASAVTRLAGDGADFYRFRVKAGDIIALELVRGAFDSTIGLFDADSGQLLVTNDDGGGGLLSRLLLQSSSDLHLAVAVSSYPDFTFTGGTGGAESGRYVLTINAYQGEILAAGDDTSAAVPLPFGYRFAGQTWNSVFVNSNGNLTFGAGDGDFSESQADLVAGPPRIAPLWDDLDATSGLVIAEDVGAFAKRIHFVSVPEFFSDAPNYFSTTLIKNVGALIEWGATARSDGLVGVSVGGGTADPGTTNLSARLLPIFSGGTVYERFVLPDPFDLNFRAALFLTTP